MTPLLALALVQAATPNPPSPADWASLPLVHMDRPSTVTPADTVAILRLVQQRPGCRAGIHPMPTPSEAGDPRMRMEGIRIQFIILVAPDGRFLNILAAPGACDAVRNYGRALVNGRMGGRVRPPAGRAPAWYRTSLGFIWEI